MLEIRNVSEQWEDILVGELFEMGAEGVQENLEFTQLDRKYKPHIVEQNIKNLQVYFSQKPHPEQLKNLVDKFSDLEISMNQFPVRDWLSEWKKQWKPFELIDGVWIVPEWEKGSFPCEGKQIIFIEPGMAFGTGTHETTQIASELLTYLIDEYKVSSLLDVGTGSGILALLAKLKGIETIFAYDNDEESKRVFLENLEKNNGNTIQWEEDWSKNLTGKAEVTLANIIDGVLLDLKSEFQKMKSRFFIFTGVLGDRESLFLEEMTKSWSLRQCRRVQKGEWVGFLFEAEQ